MSGTLANTELDRRFAFGRELIEQAGSIALDYFRRLDTLTVSAKGTHDLATEADVEVERLIRERLHTAFPEDAFLGEESGRFDVADSEGIWVVDPIDGTQPFLSGMSSWCVSIAYVHDRTIEMGFVTSPARDELFIGRRGHGATLNGAPISVSDATSLTDGIVYVGYSPRIAPDDILAPLERLLRAGGMFYRDGSGALGLCYLACGRLLGYIEPHINAWDCLGALAVIEAAGGRLNDYLAGDALWVGGPLVASVPALFDQLVETLGEAIDA